MNDMPCNDRLMAGIATDEDLLAHAEHVERQGHDATAYRACLTDLAYRDAYAESLRLWRDARAYWFGGTTRPLTRAALDARLARLRDLLETQTALEIDTAVMIPRLREELERALPV